MSDLVKIARARVTDFQQTHWEGCERDHRECLIQRMADEIERLRAENHNLNWAFGTEGYEQMATPEEQAEHDKAVHAHNEFLARLEKGKTVYEELKADAARYRWLRANRQFCAAAYPDGEWAIPAGMVFLGSDNDNADAWIDARIAQADKAMGSDHA